MDILCSENSSEPRKRLPETKSYTLLIQLNSEKVVNTRKCCIKKPDKANILNIFWYWLLLRSLAVVNPNLKNGHGEKVASTD